MITHGLPSGFDQGCHTDVSCVNHRTNLMTCREASIRYRGDYAYRKQVDAGDPPLTHEEFAKPPKAPRPPRQPRTPRSPKEKSEPPAPRAPRTLGVLDARGYVHGTTAGYRRGCRDESTCAAALAGKPSCIESTRKVGRETWKERIHGNRKPIRHGTETGYIRGCRTDCPAEPSCSQIRSAAQAARRRKKGITPRKRVQHGTVNGYQTLGCRTDCPAVAEGGRSCSELSSEYQAAARKRRKDEAA